MGEVIPRSKMERAIVAIAAGAIGPGGCVFAPMSAGSTVLVAVLIRRTRALRRRGAHTKATRRARARTYYRTTGEALR